MEKITQNQIRELISQLFAQANDLDAAARLEVVGHLTMLHDNIQSIKSYMMQKEAQDGMVLAGYQKNDKGAYDFETPIVYEELLPKKD